MVVDVREAVALECELLHLLVVEGADGIQVRTACQFLQLLHRVVHLQHLLHAVIVVPHVVLVLENTQGSLNLVFVHFVFMIAYLL